jgi:hypothetical protein
MQPEVRAGAGIQIVAARADHRGLRSLAAQSQGASRHDSRYQILDFHIVVLLVRTRY